MAASGKMKIELFIECLQAAHGLLENTMKNVTPEEAHWVPPGIANPIAANYAHVVIGEDGAIQGMLKGGAPLFASTWAGKTGVSELPPMINPEAPGFPDWSKWGRKVKIDLVALRKYTEAVYAATVEYLSSLTDDDLNRPLDLSALGLGKSTVGFLLINGLLGNTFSHSGEISCLKGLQGKQG
jgi:hypothetical protein